MYSGRIGRLGFFLGFVYLTVPVVAVIILYAVLNLLFTAVAGPQFIRSLTNVLLFVFGAVWIIALFPIGFGLYIRRWHDIGQVGWLSLLQLIGGVNFVTSIILLFVPGHSEPNKYGDQSSSLGFSQVLFGKSVPAQVSDFSQQPPTDPPVEPPTEPPVETPPTQPQI